MVPDEVGIRRISRKLEELQVEHEVIEESDPPYDGQAMAIGCNLIRDRSPMRKVVSNLPLLR